MMWRHKFEKKFNEYWHSFKHWFNSKEQYERYFDRHRFFMNILYLLILVSATKVIYKNIDFFNEYQILFIRFGSILLLVGAFFIVKYLYYIAKQIEKGYHNLQRGYKITILILILVLVSSLDTNSETFIQKIKNTTDSIYLPNFNPISKGYENNATGNGQNTYQNNFNLNQKISRATNFLPQPWGFLLFWGIILLLVLVYLQEFVFHGYWPSWMTAILVIIGIVFAFQYKIPYNTVDVSTSSAYCDNNTFKIKNNIFGIGSMAVGAECIEYKSSQCRTMCVDSKPMCQCEANAIDLVFHQKGDWILGSSFFPS